MSHHCQNLTLTCIDFRFTQTHQSFIDGLGKSDHVALAGGAKAIIDSDTRQAVLKQIGLAQSLHGITNIYLVDHEDCGAFGGKKAFMSDKKELLLHRQIIRQAKEIIQQAIPQIKVETRFIKLDGKVINL